MPFEAVQSLFTYLGEASEVGTLLLVYGPFNYEGRYTSESNASFDDWLRARDARSAIRDFEQVDALARSVGYALVEDRAMLKSYFSEKIFMSGSFLNGSSSLALCL